MSKDAIERYANLLVKNHGWTEAHRIAAEEVRGKQGNLDGFWTRVLYEIERWGRCMSKEDRMVHRSTKVVLTVIALALAGLVASQAIPGAKAFSDCGKWEHAPNDFEETASQALCIKATKAGFERLWLIKMRNNN